jgi:peptidoglycan/xylan/chitin deacetylase (PgdA/CDA1 family)
MGTSASRWAMLPQKAMPLISEVTACSGSSLKKTALLEKTPQKIFRVPAALASTTIKDGFGKAAISCYPDPPITNPGHLASAQSGQGFASYSPNVYTNCLPILMYHHICPFNAADSPRWQLTPEAFEQQLRHLRDSGFRTVTLTDWQQAMITQTPLPGKVVSLTFDDGYLDFYTTAWPLLKQYGFSASVFIITDHVGRQFEGATLMDWYHIKQLQKEGVEFGSHSAQHPVLSALSNTDMVREGLRSRLLLEKKLDTPVQAFCYPYGDSNPIVRHLIGACGYTVGLSLGERCSSFEDDLLHLSRIEIEGTDSLVRFIAKLQR